MGGAISLHVCLRRPELVRSLILMDTSAWSFRPVDPATAAVVDAFFLGLDPASGLAGFPPLPEDALIAIETTAEWQALKEEMAAAFDPYALKALGVELIVTSKAAARERLSEIVCPVTVIVGEHDQPFVDQSKALSAEVADGRLTVIQGAYHSPQLTHPREWTLAVEAHLDWVGSRPG